MSVFHKKLYLFFDEGNGFNEKNKLSKKYLLDQNNNNTFTLELDVDKNIKMIRFDPDDIGRITIDRFEISLGVDKINNYTIIGGKKYNNKIRIICEAGAPDFIIS